MPASGAIRRGRADRPAGPALGVVGVLRELRRTRPTDFLTEVARVSPQLGYFRLGGERVYLAVTPDLVRELLVTHGRATTKGRALTRARAVLGDGLLTAEGEWHRRQRRLVSPAFQDEHLARYAEVMRDEARTQAARWRDGAEVDVAAHMADLTLRIVARTLFGADLAGQTGPVAAAVTDLLGGFRRTMAPGAGLLAVLPTRTNRRLVAARRRLDRTVDELVRTHDAAGPTDLLSALLRVRDAGDALTARQIRDEVLTLLLAGHETTANALAWSWHLLSAAPAVRRWLHEELDGLARDPGFADLPAVPCTRAVVAESLRLYPPAWIVGRRASEPLQLGGWTVPRGALLVASQWVTHRDGRWWADPREFRPARWLTADGRFAESAPGQPRGAYFPFGAGRRRCVGESFAWTEAVIALATLARRWELTPRPGHVVEASAAVTLRPAGGLPMTPRRRRPIGPDRRLGGP